MKYKVKILDRKHKVKELSIEAKSKSRAEFEVEKMQEVKAILNIEEDEQ